MPYLIGADSRPGTAFSRTFDPQIEGRLRGMIIMGGDITSEMRASIPRVVRVTELKDGGVPEIIAWDIGPFIVCERLRDILEELEPGRHDFLPVEVRSEARGAQEKSYGTYYLIVGLVSLNAVVIEQTAFTKGFGREGYELSARFDPEDSGPCVLDARVIAGHHFWQLPADYGQTQTHPDRFITGFFCSNELWKRIEAEGMRGLEIRKKCVLANS